ncbi:MAG: fimbrillin family protein [Paramuribaculum sp.]|nr:fimbrillin family protein [Paramuribaculum sp.]
MRSHHIYIALTMALAAAIGMTACTDEEIYRPAPDDEPTDLLKFNLPEVNEWSASRADPDWLEQDWREALSTGNSKYWAQFDFDNPTAEKNWNLIRLNRVDNRLFKRDFVTVGAAPDVSTPNDSTSKPYYDINGDGEGDPGSYHQDVAKNHMITGSRSAVMPLLSSADAQTVGRVTMKAEPITEQMMKRYEKIAAKYSAESRRGSRGYPVDDRNVTDRYKDISVSAYCYTTCAQNAEELRDMECFDEHRDHNHKVELMYDSKVSYRKNVIDNNGQGSWNTDTTFYWTQMIGTANRVRFFAYAPYDIAVRTPDADRQKFPMILDPDEKRAGMDTPELDYLVPVSPKDQQDLSATAVTCPGDYMRTVPLKFNHLLTGVRILIDDYYMGTCIKSVKIKGVRDHGKYTWSKKPDNLATSSDDKEIEIKPGDPIPDDVHIKGTWEVDEEKDYVEYEFTHENGGLLDKPLPNELDGDQCRWEIIDFEYLMLVMPQVLTRDAILEVTFQEEGQEPETHFAHIDCRGTTDNFDPDKDPDEWHQGEMITYIITTWDIEYVLKLVKAGGVYPYPGGYDNKTVVSYAIYYERGTTNIQKIIPCPWEPEFYDAQTGQVIARPDWVKVTYDRPEPDPNEPGSDLHGKYPREYRYKDDATKEPFATPADFIEDKVCHGHVDVMRYGAQQWGGQSEMMVEPLEEATLENPVNLAVYNSMKHAGTAENSANCYIINRPGYYKFPMVYGNGLKNGSPNTRAWTQTTNTPGYQQFVGSDGQELTSEKLPTIADAAIMTSNAQYAVQLVKIDQDYLTIYVDPTYIDQGNSIVCVRDAYGTILWSWHIWTTDYDPYVDNGTVSVKVPVEDGWQKDERFDMMRFNLGWHRPDQGDDNSGQPRRIMWRPVQTHRHEGKVETRTTPNYYYIEQDPYEATRTGAAPFYNWGRKDPLMKMVHTPFSKPFLLDNSYYGATYSTRRTYDNEALTSFVDGNTYKLSDGYYFYTQMEIKWSIMLPWAIPFCYNTDNPGATHSHTRGMTWWIGPMTSIQNNPVQISGSVGTNDYGFPIFGTTGSPGNSLTPASLGNRPIVFHTELWCIGQYSSDYLHKKHGRNVIKTIYDPCPPLFTVAPARAMEYFNINNALGYSSIDDHFGYVSTTYMMLKSHLCYGYTFYKDADSKIRGLTDDDHTVTLPAMPFLSPLAGESYKDPTTGKAYHQYCLPFLSTFMNRSCSIWEADISDPESNYKGYGMLSSYFNIKGMFSTDKSLGGDNGMGITETKSTWQGHTATGNSYNNTGRQIRPVREKD